MKYCVLLLSGLLVLTGCGEDIKPGLTEQTSAMISGLDTAVIEPPTAALQRALNGTVEAPDQSQLLARLAGRVEQVLIQEGQIAAAGETILILGEQTAGDEMDAALAAVQTAASAVAEAEAHQRLAARTLQRYQQLRLGGAVTAQEFDQVTMQDEAARQKVLAGRSNLARAQASLEAARVMAGQARVKAPFEARINRILVDTGSTVMPGTPLVQLDRVGGWLISLEVPESLGGQFQPGREFDIEIPSTGQTFKGTLSEIFPAANPVARTLTVKLRLPEGADLKSGLFARVYLPTAGSSRLLIPTSAIVTRGQLTGVYVVAEGVLQYRLVRIGSQLDGQTEILSGLSPGETIVTEGATRARHGARVEE